MIWTAITLLAFVLTVVVQMRLRSPLVNPTLWTTILILVAMQVSRTSYPDYLKEVQPMTMFMGPAVVALAVPLYRLRSLLAAQWKALLLGGLGGTLTSMVVNYQLAQVFHLSAEAQKALLTTPVTSPVALQLASILKISPTLGATLAVLTGVIGAVILPSFLNLLGIKHPLARGIAIGCVSHGIGTTRAREESELTGASSSLGMGMAALSVTLLIGALFGHGQH